ncbi:MAG: DNA-3-methyladenine glycosylase I [Acidimicrobiales bacterium]
MDDILVGADGRARCWWCGDDPIYVAYHDNDWGAPIHDERELLELLCLEGFQAGLSWITILRKRPAFQAAFEGFDPEVVAGYGDREIDRLLGDAGIVRHRGKIEATIANARAVLELDESLDEVVWSYASAGPRPRTRTDIPGFTPAATALSKDLKRRGFRFVGPTTVYAFMQSAGIVDDHLAACWRSTT